jgi:hypothetical protein
MEGDSIGEWATKGVREGFDVEGQLVDEGVEVGVGENVKSMFDASTVIGEFDVNSKDMDELFGRSVISNAAVPSVNVRTQYFSKKFLETLRCKVLLVSLIKIMGGMAKHAYSQRQETSQSMIKHQKRDRTPTFSSKRLNKKKEEIMIQ